MHEPDEEKAAAIQLINQRKYVAQDPYYVAGPVQVLLKQNNRNRARKKYVWVASLGENKALLDLELLAQGEAETIDVNPRGCFKIAIRVDAVGIVWITNRIDGGLIPSEWDRSMVEKLLIIASLIDIPLLDYVLVNETGYYSYKEQGVVWN